VLLPILIVAIVVKLVVGLVLLPFRLAGAVLGFAAALVGLAVAAVAVVAVTLAAIVLGGGVLAVVFGPVLLILGIAAFGTWALVRLLSRRAAARSAPA